MMVLPGDVAELVDALASGVSECKLVEVQVLSSPPFVQALKGQEMHTQQKANFEITGSS